jgi:hypothetical protein
LLAGAGLGWFGIKHAQYSREAAVVKRLVAHDAVVLVEPRGPQWLRSILPDPWHHTLDRVVELDLEYSGAYYEDLAEFSELERLNFGRCHHTARMLASLKYTPRLKELKLWPTDDGWGNALAQLTSLESLELGALPPSEAAFLGEMHQLRRLKIDGAHVKPETLAHIARLSRLQVLDLSTQYSPGSVPTVRLADHLALLASMTSLEELDLKGNSFEEGSLKELTRLPWLRRLRLSGPSVSDLDAPALAQLTNLEELAITGTDMTDDGLKWIARLEKLHTLDLGGGDFTDRGVRQLSMLPLERVNLTDTRCSFKAIVDPQVLLPHYQTATRARRARQESTN